jgi:regulator of protease activity HflC (stomatin/prohibitin superfamily)
LIAISSSLVVFLTFAVPALGFLAYLLIQGALIRVDTGEYGLVVVRGKPSGRTLTPGTHFIKPFGRMMIQSYPSRELSYRTTRDASSEDDSVPSSDPPVGVVLGDRSHALVCYTVRFRLDPDRLRDIHLRFGPEGIYSIVRDVSEQQVADGLAQSTVSYERLFGKPRALLQTALRTRIAEALASEGFIVTMFGLREVDLGEIGEAVQAKARAQALNEQYEVAAAARRIRAQHDVEIAALLVDMPEIALKYQQVEALRGLVDRWDGRIGIPSAAPAQRQAADAQSTEAHQ